MEINQEIRDRIKDIGIPENDGVAYLLSVYFECIPSTTSRVLIKQMQMTKILSIVDKKLHWQVPLFADETKEPEDKWNWVVTEYRELFKSVNQKRTGPKNSSVSRMKRFFADNPDVRKEDVIGATKMYIRNLSSPEYITSAHYFIFKGTGVNKISGLEDWVDKYKSYLATTNTSSDITKSMQ